MKNRLGIIHDPEALRRAERNLATERRETVADVTGNFDGAHLRAIHRHIFQDVYEWAGTTRADRITLEGEVINVPQAVPGLAKGSTTFLPSAYVERGLAQVALLANTPEARSADPDTFADAAAETLSALNHVHPFREGNGRTQRAFLEQMAARAGHELDFRGVTAERMIAASIESGGGSDAPLRAIVRESIDHARVDRRLKAVAQLAAQGFEVQDFWIETPEAGARVSGTFVSRTEDVATIATEENRLIVMHPLALPADARINRRVDFIATGETALHIAADALGTMEKMPPGTERDAAVTEFADILRSVEPDLRRQIIDMLDARDEPYGTNRDDHDL